MSDADQTPLVIRGARCILPDGIREASVRIEAGRIAGLDLPTDGARVIEAAGRLLAPAMVDIHGDAFERQLMPRPNVFFPVEAAVLETDRQLAANGIATAFHALTLSWEPGLRSVAQAEALVAALARLAPRLTVENRLQLRWESFCFEALPLIERALAAPLTPSLAFNDHTSMGFLDPSVPLQERPFELDPDFPTVDTTTAGLRRQDGQPRRPLGAVAHDFVALIRDIWQRRPQVPAHLDRAAALARAAGAPMLSHDDSQIATRDFFRGLGAGISEFPMNAAVAQAAREAGDWIVFGAPNAVRGGSHIGSPSVAGMIDRGLCDILASDYFYPAMLSAVARLAAENRAPLHALWKLVSTNPARASGLADRGEIAPGQRADLVLLDWPEGALPAPLLLLVAGRAAYAAQAAGGCG